MNNHIKYKINFDDIQFIKALSNGKCYSTYFSTLLTDMTSCASKILKNEDEKEFEPNFIKYINMVLNLSHPGLIPFIGYCSKDENKKITKCHDLQICQPFITSEHI